MGLYLFFCLSCVGVSWFLTRKYLFFAVRNHLVDRPNERSSHNKVTARGGGIPFVMLYGIYLLLSLLIYHDEWRLTLSLFIGSGVIATIGFLDDKYNLAAHFRLIFHVLAALVMLWGLGGIPDIYLFGFKISLGFFGIFFGILFLVWCLNLYNFMDGINGLAGLEVVFFIVGLTLACCLRAEINSFLPLLMLPLASFVLGFIAFNFPVARVFMGDAGSGFLGAVIGFFCLAAGHVHADFIWVGLILLGVFVVDATWTLCVRIAQKQRVFSAHRTHAYQILARRFKSHTKVTLLIMGVNIIWLLPLSLLVAAGKIEAVLGLLIAYAPLVVVCYFLRAGWVESSLSSSSLSS